MGTAKVNRARATIRHAISQHAADHTVHIEAKTLANAFGDAVASEICLRPVSLKAELKKFRAACEAKVNTLRADRKTLVEQIELGFGFSRQDLADIDSEIEQAATGKSVSMPLFPVTVGRLRDAIEETEQAPEPSESEPTTEGEINVEPES